MPGTSGLQGTGTAWSRPLRVPCLPVLELPHKEDFFSNFLTSVWNFLLTIGRFLQGSRKPANVAPLSTITMVMVSFIFASFPFAASWTRAFSDLPPNGRFPVQNWVSRNNYTESRFLSATDTILFRQENGRWLLVRDTFIHQITYPSFLNSTTHPPSLPAFTVCPSGVAGTAGTAGASTSNNRFCPQEIFHSHWKTDLKVI